MGQDGRHVHSTVSTPLPKILNCNFSKDLKLDSACLTEPTSLDCLDYSHHTHKNLRQSYRNTSHPCSYLFLFQSRNIKSHSTSVHLSKGGLISSTAPSPFWKETYIHERTTEEKQATRNSNLCAKNILDLYKNMCIWIELFSISTNTVFSFIYTAQINR